MKPHKVKIYGLYDPRDNSCFYVGRTRQSLNTRLTAHVNSIMGNGNPKKAYIDSLLTLGIRPEIRLLTEKICHTKIEIQNLETCWIEFMALTHKLTNLKKGESGCFDGDRELKLTDEQIHLLGTESDSSLARKWNVSQGTVSHHRRIREIPVYSKWSHEEEQLLGTNYDYIIAQTIGKTYSEVQNRRLKLGIDAWDGNNIKWTKKEIGLLGKISDRELAKIKGCSYSVVAKKRKSLNIKSKNTKYKWTETSLALLGTMTDKDLATKLNLTYDAVSQMRLAKGISPYESSKP